MDFFNKLRNEKDILNQVKSDNIFDMLKSKFILKIIFNNLPKSRFLEFIKYNKKIQQRINLNKTDYIQFAKQYSSIKIEIIPANNNLYEKFITIDYANEKFYHIYFNNNKEETKRNYFLKYDNITKINVKIDYQVTSLYNLFTNYKCIESIHFKQFYRTNINDMTNIFTGCSLLKVLDLSHFNTDNIDDMSNMFRDCPLLKEINLSNFNTNKVTNMSHLFYNCPLLKEINLSNINTDNVENMSFMFFGCLSLEKLNLSNLNTNNVENMRSMFNGCSSLKELDISNFDFNNIRDMSYMFVGCSSLNELNISNFITKNQINMSKMFLFCPAELQKKMKTQFKNIKEEAFQFYE